MPEDKKDTTPPPDPPPNQEKTADEHPKPQHKAETTDGLVSPIAPKNKESLRWIMGSLENNANSDVNSK